MGIADQRSAAGRSATRRRGAAAALGVVLFGVAVGFEIGGAWTAVVVDDLGELAAALLAAAVCIGRARRCAGDTRRGWALLGVSALAWAVGQALWSVYELVLRDVPFPSPADAGFLVSVPLTVLALLSFPSARLGRKERVRVVLDGLLVASSMLFVSWATVLGPVYRSNEGTLLAQVLSLAYPIGDIVVLTMATIAGARLPAGARRSMALVAAGLAAIAVADSAFAYLTQVGGYGNGHVADVGWFAGFLLIALGASCGHDEPTVGEAMTAGPSRASVLFPYVPALVAAVVAVFNAGGGSFGPALALQGFAVLVLLVTRQLLTLLENVALTKELAAVVEVRGAQLRQQDARSSALARRASDLVSIVSADAEVLYQSPSIERILGLSVERLLGTDFTLLVHPDDRRRWPAAVAQATGHQNRPTVLEWRVWHADGSWHVLETTVSNLLDEPSVGGFVLNARDVTERKSLEEQLHHNALHDPLTGLPNRALFRDRLEHALATSARSRHTVAVLSVDLDEFKSVNDEHGHDAGDALLREVARRIRHVIRQSDTVARFGGDEFTVLLECADGESEAQRVARRVVESLDRPVRVGGTEIHVQVSLGIATGFSGDDAEELLRNADVAMYAAKAAGKDRCEVFRPEMHAAVLERLSLQGDVRRAVQREDFVVHYQPILELATETVVGVEALLRWTHAERGVVPPSEFIPVAEASGMIVELGRWMLRKACRDVASWETAGGAPVTLNVNLSARQLGDDELVRDVRSAIEESGLDPSRLTLEITESMLVEHTDVVTSRLEELKAMGIRIAIDDFGTGYSSLAYLQRLPIDELKIDRSFVAELPGADDGAVVDTILSLARVLKLDTVAEGVEEIEQLRELRERGCAKAQGFLFAKPMDAAHLARHLDRPLRPVAGRSPAPR